MRLSHEDRLRALRARGDLPGDTAETCSSAEQVSDAPVQLTRSMIDAAILRSAQAPIVKTLTAKRRGGQVSRQALLPPGRVLTFLRTARQLQRLPSFANRRE